MSASTVARPATVADQRILHPEPPPRSGMFHTAVRGLRKVCLWLIALCAVILCLQWLVNTVTSQSQAESSLSANPFVQNAQLAFWPLIALFLLLFALEFLGSMTATGQFLGSLLAIVLFLTLVESFLSPALRRQLFPGTDYFWNNVWPMVWATILLAIDLLTAYVFLKGWRITNSWRDKTGTVLLVLSAVPAVIAYIGLLWPGMEDMSTNALWALALYLLGIGLITTRENKEPVSKTLKLREEGH